MGIRTWMLRRAMGRLRITDDIVRYLSTFQRLGETVEVEVPGELLPVGARTVFRAVRTRAAAQLGMDGVWPWWLERQLDPRSPAFVPRGHLPLLTNVTGRAWTMVGNPGSSRKAIVDPRGLITPWYDGWSLDWWVEADDGWHLPSRDGGRAAPRGRNPCRGDDHRRAGWSRRAARLRGDNGRGRRADGDRAGGGR